jgi:hypothetical protein
MPDNVLSSTDPASNAVCFQRDTCSYECGRFWEGGRSVVSSCKIAQGDGKVRRGRRNSAFFDITKNPVMMDAKRKVCESGLRGKKFAHDLAKKTHPQLEDAILRRYPGMKLSAKRKFLALSAATKRMRAAIKAKIPRRRSLRKFFSALIRDRTCEKVQTLGNTGAQTYTPPPKFIAKWKKWLLTTKHKNEPLYQDEGLKIAYNVYIFEGRRCLCKDLFKHLRKVHKKSKVMKNKIKLEEKKMSMLGKGKCELLKKEKCGKKENKVKKLIKKMKGVAKKAMGKIRKFLKGKGRKGRSVKRIRGGRKVIIRGKAVWLRNGRHGNRLRKIHRMAIRKVHFGLRSRAGPAKPKKAKKPAPVKKPNEFPPINPPVVIPDPRDNADNELHRLITDLIIESEATTAAE